MLVAFPQVRGTTTPQNPTTPSLPVGHGLSPGEEPPYQNPIEADAAERHGDQIAATPWHEAMAAPDARRFAQMAGEPSGSGLLSPRMPQLPHKETLPRGLGERGSIAGAKVNAPVIPGMPGMPGTREPSGRRVDTRPGELGRNGLPGSLDLPGTFGRRGPAGWLDVQGRFGANRGLPSGNGIPGSAGSLPGRPEWGRGPKIKDPGAERGQEVGPKATSSSSPPPVVWGTVGDRQGSGQGKQTGREVGGIIGSELGSKWGAGGSALGGRIGGDIGEYKGDQWDKNLSTLGGMLNPPSSEELDPGSADMSVSGGQSAGTSGGYSSDPNAPKGKDSSQGPAQTPKGPNQSTTEKSKKDEPNQSKDPNQSTQPTNQSKATDESKPNPDERPPEDGNGGSGPRSNVDMPADDSGGGGTPWSSLGRPADDSGGTGDPRSRGFAKALVSTATVSAREFSAAVR